MSDERDLMEYGSYYELCKQRHIFRTTKDNRYKRAFNDYKSYRKDLKFIENNIYPSFTLPTEPQSVSPREENTECVERGDATEIHRTEVNVESNDREADVHHHVIHAMFHYNFKCMKLVCILKIPFLIM